MNGGFFGTGGEVIPTIDEVRLPNLQWQTTFTVDPASDILTCAAPHLQVAGSVVMVSSSGTLPSPLQPFFFYRVLTAGLGWARIGSPTDFITASSATDLITTPIPHGLSAGDWVMLYDSVDPLAHNIPSPLLNTTQYFVSASGLTATSFKVSYAFGGPPVDLLTNAGLNAVWVMIIAAGPGSATTLMLANNAGWNPPPESPPINILDTGVGIHHLWIRPLDFVGRVSQNFAGADYIASESIPGRGAIYLDNAKRHQYKNISGIPGIAPNIDYWTYSAAQRPWTKWKIGLSLGSGTGAADLWAYAYPAVTEWGLGDLGVITGGGGENYYSLCGDCAFGQPPGGGGGGPGGEAGRKVPMTPDRMVKIEYRDQDITNLVRRAQKASSTIENLRIIGPGVSGGEGSWQINPE